MKNNKNAVIQTIAAGSIAEEAGMQPGDRILSIDGQPVKDIFDYRFLSTQEKFVLRLQKPDGDLWDIDIEKDEYEDLGVEFAEPLADCERSCSNKCIFCFIDQLPKGMRNTLYFKDDDARLSFLTGNYITMTNMDNDDIDRIIKYRLSPVNVSVHTTNPELRKFMLRNRFAGDVAAKIGKLVSSGISVNCQIVLCRGINDGEELDRSIEELAEMYPGVHSISVVPVGLTKHRKELFDLVSYDRGSSSAVICQLENHSRSFIKKYGSAIVYAADEFYALAGREIPEYNKYEDFPQLENGVGMLSLFKHEFNETLQMMQNIKPGKERVISVATGMLAYEFMAGCAKKMEKLYNGLKIKVYGIKNDFFGESVTVSGLVTGIDMIRQLSGKELGGELLIPANMLRAGERVFLDDVTVEELEKRLAAKVTAVHCSGEDFIRSVLPEEKGA